MSFWFMACSPVDCYFFWYFFVYPLKGQQLLKTCSHLGYTYQSLRVYSALISHPLPFHFTSLPHHVCIWYTCRRCFGVPSEAFYGDHGAAEKANIYSFLLTVNIIYFFYWLHALFKRVCSERAGVHLDSRGVSSTVFYVWTHHKPLKLYGKWTYAVFQCQTSRAVSRLCGGIWDSYERGLWSCRAGPTPHKDVFWRSTAHLQMVSPHSGLLWIRYLTTVLFFLFWSQIMQNLIFNGLLF